MDKPVFEDWITKTVLNEYVASTVLEIIKQYPRESGWLLTRYPDEKIGEDKTRIVFKVQKYEIKREEHNGRTR